MIKDRQPVARFLVSRGCQTDVLMAAALGDRALVERHLDGDPECVRMTTSARWFPRQHPKAAPPIYLWTVGGDKGPHVIARDFGHQPIFDLLLERSPDDVRLGVWCELADERRVRELLARDPQIAQRLDPADHRKLPDAAREQNAAAVRLMLDAGWPIDARGQHGGTALHWAAWNGMPDMVEALLRRGAPLHLKDDDFEGTPLDWAKYASEGNGWPCSPGDYPTVIAALIAAAR